MEDRYDLGDILIKGWDETERQHVVTTIGLRRWKADEDDEPTEDLRRRPSPRCINRAELSASRLGAYPHGHYVCKVHDHC